MSNPNSTHFSRLVIVSLFCAFATQAVWAQDGIRTQQVQFAMGASSTIVKGSIKGSQIIDYMLHASQGQTMTVRMTTSNGASYFNLMAPGETEVAFFNASVDGNNYQGVLPATGDYTIRVYLMRSAARRNEVANFSLDVAVAGAAQGSAGHDALVAGTNYNATAKIPCVAEPDKPMSQCSAGVKRSVGGGTVHVTTPDGGSRVITFVNHKVSATDADAPFKTERRDDWTIVRIGAVEVYEIPDAFIFGG